MSKPQRALGKGLSALISEEYSQTASSKQVKKEGKGASAETVPSVMSVDRLASGKFQPRARFENQNLEELAQSIGKNGIMQPIIIRAISGGKYEIIAGERRWRAAKIAGLKEVPVIVRDINDQTALELALVENIQREDLTPLEEGAGYQRLIDEFGYTQDELAQTVGKSRSHIANLLRLLELPREIKDYLEAGTISAGHARALLGAKDPSALAKEVVRRGLNVRQTENLVRSGNPNAMNKSSEGRAGRSSESNRTSNGRDKDPDILALEETLSENLGLKVSITDRGQTGEISIAYSSLEQLDEVLRRLGGGA